MWSNRLEVDIGLGELAVDMDTRLHGKASREPVRGINNRAQLDHRSAMDRLLHVTPSDGPLLLDANANGELLHIAANNGLCKRSRHSEVPKSMEELLQGQLRPALNQRKWIPLAAGVPGPVDGRRDWVWTAVDEGGALFVLVHHLVGESKFLVAAFAAGCGKKGLLSWEAVWLTGPPSAGGWPPPPLWDTDGPLHVPTGRWLLLRLFPSALSSGAEASWLFAFSRCVAWAWFLLDRPPTQARIGTDTESPIVRQYSRAIARSVEAAGDAVVVETDGWRLAASDETSKIACMIVCLWPPRAPGPGEASPMVVAIHAPADGTVQTDRLPDPSGLPFHPDLDDYVESVLVAAARIYWKRSGLTDVGERVADEKQLRAQH